MDPIEVILEVDTRGPTSRRDCCHFTGKTEGLHACSRCDCDCGGKVVVSKRRCLVRVANQMKVRWDLGIMLLAMWNCFYVPFEVAFLGGSEDPLMVAADILIDSAYIIDIFVSARCSYVDLSSGEEVLDSCKILHNYFVSGKLIIDLISAIPFDIVSWITSTQQELQLITLSKVVRLMRLSKIIMFMQSKTHVKLKLKLAQLLFIFSAYLHTVACTWFLVTNVEQLYTPPALYVMEHPDLYTSNCLRKYAYSLYMAVYMLTGAEVGPRTEWERVFAGVAIISGQIFQAFMFGEIAVVISDMNIKSQKISEIQDAAATSMVNMHMDPDLSEKISAFLESNQSTFLQFSEFTELFERLSPSLKQEVRSKIFARVIRLNPVIANRSKLADFILMRLTNSYCQPEKKIIIQGDKAESMYFVASGSCEVWVLDEWKAPHRCTSLGIGAHFGEVALLFPTPRTATVIATNHASIAELSRTDFSLLCKRFPKALAEIKESALKYRDQWKHFLKLTLRRCPFFRNLPGRVLNDIIPLLPTTRLQANTLIYKEGEEVDKITFVIEGKVQVYLPVNDSKLRKISQIARFTRPSLITIPKKRDMRYLSKLNVDVLEMGSVICPNMTLLRGKASTFVKTEETTIVMSLSKDLLSSICNRSAEVREAVNNYTESVLLANCHFAHFRRIQLVALDYEKPVISDLRKHSLWTAKMKVRRCAIGKMLEKRHLRSKGFPDIPNLSRKLRAILEAELHEDFDLAEKIRLGTVLHSMKDVTEAFKLMRISEVENPILTQFAVEAAKVRDGLINFERDTVAVRKETTRLTSGLQKTKRDIDSILRVGKLMGRLVAINSV